MISNDTAHGTRLIWRDGYTAAMVRVETCILAGDMDRLYREVNAALARKPQANGRRKPNAKPKGKK